MGESIDNRSGGNRKRRPEKLQIRRRSRRGHMTDRIWEWIEQEKMIEAGDLVIAGVSGGADSVCLLLCLLEYQKKIDFSVRVVHVEHGIRGEESLRDARFVRELCEKKTGALSCLSCRCPGLCAGNGHGTGRDGTCPAL